jgi:PHD/YefM family antitoxin component YafN of YafNO toxin-antitoxin module
MTKTIQLKEAREMYAAEIDPAQLAREPIILERNGEPVGAVISLEEFRAFKEWKKELERQEQEFPKQFLEDEAAFKRMQPELLKTHKDKWVAVLKGQVVDFDDKLGDLADRVYRRFGYQAIYMSQVLEKERIYRFLSPRVVR